MKKRFCPLALVVILLITLAAGYIGSLFTLDSIPTWYASLQKPAFNPPNWIFGPVWTTLYILMAVAAYFIWEKRDERGVVPLLVVYVIQLVLNSLWSIIFFYFHNLGLAFVEIIVLYGVIWYLTIQFFLIRKSAGWLMVPYILWVSFAMILNLAIWQLNY